ncbi:hypothetical protein PILCRDRAFT_811941 [Piloderma croceum F 1598]|uniref:Uncharacterized protein n=1 Tax=Piloderma croceum (strain F 1598) TaxID=765440 RepID=A0A0C3GHU8_PILCF|nr:hypothetical protein PILCRDRAFT_811941 [Piloderma croceum F 1598]
MAFNQLTTHFDLVCQITSTINVFPELCQVLSSIRLNQISGSTTIPEHNKPHTENPEPKKKNEKRERKERNHNNNIKKEKLGKPLTFLTLKPDRINPTAGTCVIV